MLGMVAALGQTAACTCAERTAEDPPDDGLLERRVPGCEALCSSRVSECGPPPNEIIKTQDQCVFECASVDGDISADWGYNAASGEDVCAVEWQAHTDCILALSCDAQKVYWQPVAEPPPPEERSCHAEWEAMQLCVYENARSQGS